MKKNDETLQNLQSSIDLVTDFLIDSVPLEKLPICDAIFVFGHYEPQVAQHAAELWKKGKAPVIIITGKGRDDIPAGFETEADFYQSIMIANKISVSCLILERESTNSLENVLMGMMAAGKTGVNPKSIILCAMPPLLRRSCATFRKQFPEIVVYGSAFPLPESWFTPSRVNRLTTEVDRLINYAQKGDIVEVVIPNQVLSAVERIRQLNVCE